MLTRWRITRMDGAELGHLDHLADAGYAPFHADSVVVDTVNGLVTLERPSGPFAYAEEVPA